MGSYNVDSPPSHEVMPFPDFSLEGNLIEQGYLAVAGVDEVGRGALAGPVVAAAVVLDKDNIPDGLNDSKRLTKSRRDDLFRQIFATAQAISFAAVPATSIDQSNIRLSSLDAMRKATVGLTIQAEAVLVDGRDAIPQLSCLCKPLIKGDQRSVSIAAASIVAKVVRDQVMAQADKTWPGYGFASHVGYGTRTHREEILKRGPVLKLHRLSYKTFNVNRA